MAEFVSQTKFFVDAGKSVGGSGGASLLLETCKSADVKSDEDVEVVVVVGVSQGAGFRDKQGGGEITLTCLRLTGATPEFDWRAAKRDRKRLTFTIQDEEGGLRESFTCRVAKIDSKDDDAGVHEDTIVLKYTKRY